MLGAMGIVFATCAVSSCAETPRTTTNFCRVLGERIDEIVAPPTNNDEIERLIDHYDRLADVAPLEVQADLLTIRDLFIAAADIDVDDPASVQNVADLAYLAEQAAEDAGIYVGATCGLDLSTGLAVQVPTTP